MAARTMVRPAVSSIMTRSLVRRFLRLRLGRSPVEMATPRPTTAKNVPRGEWFRWRWRGVVVVPFEFDAAATTLQAAANDSGVGFENSISKTRRF